MTPTELFTANRPLIVFSLRGKLAWFARVLGWDDAYQVASIGLWAACRRFNADRKVKFSWYAWVCMRHELQHAVAAKARRPLFHLEEPFEDTEAVEPRIDDGWSEAAISHLPKREQLVIRRRYGFGSPPETLAKIGRQLGVSKERVRQLQKRALERMRVEAAHA